MLPRAEPAAIVERLDTVPILRAGTLAGYGALFNAGLLYHVGVYHLFVRAVRAGYERNDGPGPRFTGYISDVVVFTSDDGLDYRFAYVLVEAGSRDVHCYEDPRVQRVRSAGTEHVVMTYTNLPSEESGLPWRIGAHRVIYVDGRWHLDEASGTLLGPDSTANKDAVIFNLADDRIALIHRVHPDMQLAIFDDLDHLWRADAVYWDAYMAEIDHHAIISPSPDALGVGAGAPPVHTDNGLVLLYHERISTGAYTMKVALLDHATGRVIAHLDEPILWPELDWERCGDVNDVIFVQGAHRVDHDQLYVVYGAADSHVGAASLSLDRLMSRLSSAA